MSVEVVNPNPRHSRNKREALGKRYEIIDEYIKYVRMHVIYNAMFFIKDIHKLKPWEGIYFYKNLPVYGVTVVGIVTEVMRSSKVLSFRVADATGSIRCTFFLDDFKEKQDFIENQEWTPAFRSKRCLMALVEKSKASLVTIKEVELGMFVHVRGDLRKYKGARELRCRVLNEVEREKEPWYNIHRLVLYKRFYNIKFDWKKDFINHNMSNPALPAIKLLRHKRKPTFTRQDIINLRSGILEGPNIAIAIDDMVRHGFAFKMNNAEEMYQIVEQDNELQKIVHDFVRDVANKTGADVNIDRIFRQARYSHRSINKEHVRQALRVLENKSLVYSTTDENHFNIV